MRLYTLNGDDFQPRFPCHGGHALPARSCRIAGKAIVTDEAGLAVLDLLRQPHHCCSPRVIEMRVTEPLQDSCERGLARAVPASGYGFSSSTESNASLLFFQTLSWKPAVYQGKHNPKRYILDLCLPRCAQALHPTDEAHDRYHGRPVSVETQGRCTSQLDPSPVGGCWGADFGTRRR